MSILSKAEFIRDYLDEAVYASSVSGIDPLAILTQAAHESAWAKYAFGNNFFGIKAGKNWTGEKQLLRTTEYVSEPNAVFPEVISKEKILVNGIPKWKYVIRDYFRKYPTAADGFIDHSLFLARNKRYRKALENKGNPEVYLTEIAKAGYATDPNYSKKLLTLYHEIKKLVDEHGRAT